MTKRGKRPSRRTAPAKVFDGWQGASAVVYADAGEVLERLGSAVAERDRLGAHVADLVAQGRSQGLTWTQLATPLGVTPQAVQKRYGSRVGD